MERGIGVSARGRIPQDVLDAYESANDPVTRLRRVRQMLRDNRYNPPARGRLTDRDMENYDQIIAFVGKLKDAAESVQDEPTQPDLTLVPSGTR